MFTPKILKMERYKPDVTVLDHTADIGIIVRGHNIKNLFKTAALAMMQLMITNKSAQPSSSIHISIKSTDPADLMVRWLGEILYLFHGEKAVVIHSEIHFISPTHLEATLGTARFNPDLHEVLCEIKAVTFHQIEVMEKDDCWEGKVIFDV